MTNNGIYCVTSVTSLGCTFLDWSILWLSGQTEFFSVKSLTWHDIIADPLQSNTRNAHGHIKNHVSGWEQNIKCINTLWQYVRPQHLLSAYPNPLYVDLVAQKLGIQIHDLSTSSQLQRVWQYQKTDYEMMLDWIVNHQKIPLVYVAFDPSVRGYKWTHRTLDRFVTKPCKPNTADDLIQEYQDTFFAEFHDKWSSGSSHVWDRREQLALNIRPFDTHWDHDFCLNHDHFRVDCQDLWFDTQQVLYNIMSWLGIPIVPQRLLPWSTVVAKWQQIQNAALHFPRSLPDIMEAIVHGHHMDLPDLTFYQESIIQHCLIYQHNLNLRTWQLERFPNDTYDLHQLLEPNCHPLIEP